MQSSLLYVPIFVSRYNEFFPELPSFYLLKPTSGL